MKTLKEMIEVMQAADDGKEIKYRHLNEKDGWKLCFGIQAWDWMHYEYDVVGGTPKKKRVPLTMDDLNPGWIIRNRACKFAIAEVAGDPDDPPAKTGVLPAGSYWCNLVGFDEMAEHGHEYSPDGGKTWHPCWKEVEK